jgi:16S rRNA (guanine527-N7)-methyltransferase
MLKKFNNRMQLAEELRCGISQSGLLVDDMSQEKLLDYLTLMTRWNKVYNLTAIRDPHQMVIHHLLDSLVVLPHLYAGRWLDVGCGAGLPGLVIAICRPDWSVTLLDSNTKKTSFVQQAIIELKLKNTRVISARVEEFTADVKFDGIISRAFTELGDFLRITRHLIVQQGHWVAMKGLPEQELAGVPDEYLIEAVIPLSVPGLNAARSLVIATAQGTSAI